VGKRLDIHQVEQRPSIGKLSAQAAAMEPVARDSLFSTSTSRSSAKRSPRLESQQTEPVNPLSAAAMRMPAWPAPATTASFDTYQSENPWADVPSKSRDIDIQQVAARAFERPQFVLDDAGEVDYDEEDPDGDLMAQVDTFLASSADDGGKTAAVTDQMAQSGRGESLSSEPVDARRLLFLGDRHRKPCSFLLSPLTPPLLLQKCYQGRVKA
jgi:hypothetical protein